MPDGSMLVFGCPVLDSRLRGNDGKGRKEGRLGSQEMTVDIGDSPGIRPGKMPAPLFMA